MKLIKSPSKILLEYLPLSSIPVLILYICYWEWNM
jgi:hypothetical protein